MKQAMLTSLNRHNKDIESNKALDKCFSGPVNTIKARVILCNKVESMSSQENRCTKKPAEK